METVDIRELVGQNIVSVDMLKSVLADQYRQPLQKINYMAQKGDLIALKRGVYLFAQKYRKGELNHISIANILHKPSYVSFEYALSYHGLIPERVYTITSATTAKSANYSTDIGDFSYQKIPAKAYPLGVDWLYNDTDGGHLIATAEKALSDKVYSDKRVKSLSEGDVLGYLVEDLRIEQDELIRLDSKLFWHISMAYSSKTLLNVAKVLKRIQNG